MSEAPPFHSTRRGLLQGIAALAALPAAGAAAPDARAAAAPLDFAEPPGGEVFLARTYVAGIPYYDARAAATDLAPGAPLRLRREPGNPHDGLAIEVLCGDGRKLGYVPRDANPPYARLMDAGATVFAEVEEVRGIGGWLDIDLRLGLRLGPGGRLRLG